jgi:hypothetical protein
VDEPSCHWGPSSCSIGHQLSGTKGMNYANLSLYRENTCKADFSCTAFFCIYIQTINPSGCTCPAHYVLNAHFRCVRPGHSSSVHVNPTGCSCPANYQLNSHNRCQCVSSNNCGNHLVWNSDTCQCELPYNDIICPPEQCSIPVIGQDCICLWDRDWMV